MTRLPTAPRRRRQVPVLTQAVVAAVLCLSAAGPALGYVRYRSESDCPYAWRQRSIPITGFPQGLAGMTVEQITDAAVHAAAVWSKGDPALAACTDLDLRVTMKAASVAPPEAKFDRKNNLMFRSDGWCVDQGSPDCHDSSALAITSVFSRTWGQIVDADIEVNGVNFVWADLSMSSAAAGSQDLQNAVTHEMGHLIGLDHTCSLDPTAAAALDNMGQAVPTCVGASAAVRATTMFASAEPGDTTKRDLAPDDQRAVCETYPLGAQDPLACPAPDGGGCGIAPRSSIRDGHLLGPRELAWGSAAIAVAAFATLVGTRRRSRRPR